MNVSLFAGRGARVVRAVCAALCFASCASAPARLPDWAERGIEAVYPRASFIAQEGRGATKEAARTDALAALSRYFVTEVETSSRSSASWAQGGAGSSVRIDSGTFVHSATRLFAVRYAEPVYDARLKEYTSAAYINRDEAWAIFEPRVREEIDTFRALFRSAESETAPLKMFFGAREAQNYAARGEFTAVMRFGQALHPANMEKLSAEARSELAALPAKINEAKSMASIFIDCRVDFESNVAGTLTRLLSGEGLYIASSRADASAVCSAVVDEGYQFREGVGHFYFPSLTVKITGTRGETLFSYGASPGRQAVVTADVAKRRAYSALASALENGFIAGLYAR